MNHLGILFKMQVLGLPQGTMDKNVPTDAGDIGLIPGLGRFHMWWSSQAQAPQLLKPVL